MKPPVLIIIGMIGWMIGVTTGAGAYEARVTQIVHKNQFPKVTVYLSVLDPNGQPVTGLAASNFKLTENDREVTDLRPGNLKSEPVSAMLVMDRSGSMDTANKMQGAKEAASKFIQLMNPQDRCGIITFDDNIETLQSLTSDQQALLKKVKAIEPGAQTAFYDAVYEAINQHKEIPGRKLIIALTDGLDNSSRRQRQEIVNYAQQEGIPVDTIGLGQKSESASPASDEGYDERGLQDLAQQTGGRFSFRPSAEQLASLYATISNQVKKEYALTYTTPNSQCDGQKRDVEVTVSLAGGTTVAHGSYNPGGIMGGAQVPTSDKSAWKRNLIVLVAILISVLFLVFAPWWLEHFQKRRRATSLGPIPSPPDRADVVGRGSAEVEIKILREDAGPPAPAPSVDDIGIRLGDEDSPLAISSDLGPTETVSPREEASGDPSAPTPPSEESLSITLDDIEVESGRERTS